MPKPSINEILGNEALRKFNTYAQVRSCCTYFPVSMSICPPPLHLSVPLSSFSPSPSPCLFPLLPVSSSLFLFPAISLCQPNPIPCPFSFPPLPHLPLTVSQSLCSCLRLPLCLCPYLCPCPPISILLSLSSSSYLPVLFLRPLAPLFAYPSLSPHPLTTTLPPHRAALVGTGTS